MSDMAWRYDEDWRWDLEWHPAVTVRTITVIEPADSEPTRAGKARLPFGFGDRTTQPEPAAPEPTWYGNPS